MKKIILLTTLILSIFTKVNAQDCKCNPNGFNPFVYTYNGTNQTVRGGHQFTVKCSSPIKLNGGYKCSYSTEICNAKLKASIKNSAGVVIKNYENFSFPLDYEFETGGNYVVEITPYCADKACTSVKFYFNVLCDTKVDCKCNDAKGWIKLATITDKVVKLAKCGDTFNIKKTQKFGITGNYKCIGDCAVILKGTVVNTKTGWTQDFPSIRLDGEPLVFPGTGSYKLIITPVCNGTTCEPCVFYVNIN